MAAVLVSLVGCTLEFDPALLSAGDAGGGAAATVGPSCARDTELCPTEVSCCASEPLPGGTFDRSFDASGTASQPDASVVEGWQAMGAAPASVSPFRMDLFEVTVRRFRRFTEDFDRWRSMGNPAPGVGAHPLHPETGGWDPAWNSELPATAAAIRAGLLCAEESTWTDEPADRELHPIDCATFYVAFAFCVWDGGRLPTEAEWNFAAAGGEEQRAFPWSAPPSDLTITEAHAVFTPVMDPGAPEFVGSRAALDRARWGQHDLAGNVREWVADGAPEDLADYPLPCSDCVGVGSPAARIRRGGDYAADAARARSAYRSSMPPGVLEDYHGIRCVRAP